MKHAIKKDDIYEELKRNPNNVRFDKLCKAVELFGFGLKVEKVVILYTPETV